MQKKRNFTLLTAAICTLAVLLACSIALLASDGLRRFIILIMQEKAAHKAINRLHWEEFIVQNAFGMAAASAFLIASALLARSALARRSAVSPLQLKEAMRAALIAIGVFAAANLFHTASSLVFMLAFYALCLAALKSAPCPIQRKSFGTPHWIILGATAIFFVLFTLYWARQNNSIYEWDHGGYWMRSIMTSDYIFSQPFIKALGKVYLSVNDDAYNILLCSVISLWIKLFGNSYHTYVFINCIAGLLPAIAVISLIAAKLNKGKLSNGTVFAIAAVLSVLFSANYYAVFVGYIDIACLLPMSCAVYLLVDYDTRRIDAKRDVFIALMLCLSWLGRRYVIYFIIGYVMALAVKSAALLLGGKEDKAHLKKSIKCVFFNAYIIGTVSIAVLLLPFGRFVCRAITGNYRYEYQDFDAPLATKLLGIMDTYSLFVIVLLASIGVLCVIMKRHRTVYFSLAALAVIETVLFYRTQDMGVHHKLILNLPVFIICILPVCLWNEKRSAKVLSVCVAVIFALNFTSAFFINMPRVFSHRHRRLYRSDTENVVRLVDKLYELSNGGKEMIYVASSNSILNASILRRAKAPLTFFALDNLEYSNADIGDGFNVLFFTAKYCVTTDYVLLCKTESVSNYLGRQVQDADSYIGRHYKEVYEEPLQHGIKAKVYERTSIFTAQDKQKMADYFDALYPNDTDRFGKRILAD